MPRKCHKYQYERQKKGKSSYVPMFFFGQMGINFILMAATHCTSRQDNMNVLFKGLAH